MNNDEKIKTAEKFLVYLLKQALKIAGFLLGAYFLFVLFVGGIFYKSFRESKNKSWTMNFVLDGHDMCTRFSSGTIDGDLFSYPDEYCGSGGYFAYISLNGELILIGDEYSLSGQYAPHNEYSVAKVLIGQHNGTIEFTDYNQLYDYLVKNKGMDIKNVEIGNIFREIKRQGEKTTVKGLRSAVNLDKYLSETDGKIEALKESWINNSPGDFSYQKTLTNISGVALCVVEINDVQTNEKESEIHFCDERKFSTKAVKAYATAGEHVFFFEGSSEFPFFLNYKLTGDEVKEYYSAAEFNKALKEIYGNQNMNVADLAWRPISKPDDTESNSAARYEIGRLARKWGKPEIYSYDIGGFGICFNKTDPYARFCAPPPKAPCKATFHVGVLKGGEEIRDTMCERNYDDEGGGFDARPLSWTLWAYAKANDDYIFMFTNKDLIDRVRYLKFFISNPWNPKRNSNYFSTTIDITDFLSEKYGKNYSDLHWTVIAEELENKGVLKGAIPDADERNNFVESSKNYVKRLNDDYVIFTHNRRMK